MFDPINAASFSSPESKYKYGLNEVSILAEHYNLEKPAVLTEWKEFTTTLSQFTTAQDVLMSLVKHQQVFPNLAHIASCLRYQCIQLIVNVDLVQWGKSKPNFDLDCVIDL